MATWHDSAPMNPLDADAERLAAQRQDYTGDEPSFFGPLQPGDALQDSVVLSDGLPQGLAARLGGCYQLLYFVRGDGLLDDEERRMLHALLRARTPVLPLLIHGDAAFAGHCAGAAGGAQLVLEFARDELLPGIGRLCGGWGE